MEAPATVGRKHSCTEWAFLARRWLSCQADLFPFHFSVGKEHGWLSAGPHPMRAWGQHARTHPNPSNQIPLIRPRRQPATDAQGFPCRRCKNCWGTADRPAGGPFCEYYCWCSECGTCDKTCLVTYDSKWWQNFGLPSCFTVGPRRINCFVLCRSATVPA